VIEPVNSSTIRRRFPPIGGWPGRAYVVLLGLAYAAELLGITLFLLSMVQENAQLLIISVLALLSGIAAGALASGLWYAVRKSSGEQTHLRPLRPWLIWGGFSLLTTAATLGGAGYLAFNLQGTHRLAFAAAVVFAGTALNEIPVIKLLARGRTQDHWPGWQGRTHRLVAVGAIILSLLVAAGLVVAGIVMAPDFQL